MSRKTTSPRERLFILTWTDRYGERRGPMRHYLHLDTAAARATQLLITSGEPGDGDAARTSENQCEWVYDYDLGLGKALRGESSA